MKWAFYLEVHESLIVLDCVVCEMHFDNTSFSKGSKKRKSLVEDAIPFKICNVLTEQNVQKVILSSYCLSKIYYFISSISRKKLLFMLKIIKIIVDLLKEVKEVIMRKHSETIDVKRNVEEEVEKNKGG